ncbi:hypothetical protein B0H19DRAFT_1199932 [Mycena capillaripes]|nr:hypothetical protein B0H19DRAFT_1199932 [Mycena capillaripes]
MYEYESTYLYIGEQKFKYGTPGGKREGVSTIQTIKIITTGRPAEQISTMKDEGKHRGHGKRKEPPQWREMKRKEKGNEIEHVIALPPHTLTVLHRPLAAKALEVQRELHTGNGEEDADQARVPVACRKRRGGKTRACAPIWAAAAGRHRHRGARTLKRGR